MLNQEGIKQLLSNIPSGYLKPNNEFFQKANKVIWQPYKKLGAITNIETDICEAIDEIPAPVKEATACEIYCNIMGCQKTFNDTMSYQRHYNSVHRYHCAECKKSLPTEHLLDIHITEQHDSFFAARIARGNAEYKCFVEECNVRFDTSGQRKDHCIKQHNFPGNFRFSDISTKGNYQKASKIIDDDGKKNGSKMELNKKTNEIGNFNKTKAFCFGHQKVPAFHLKETASKSTRTLEEMDTLKQALDDISD